MRLVGLIVTFSLFVFINQSIGQCVPNLAEGNRMITGPELGFSNEELDYLILYQTTMDPAPGSEEWEWTFTLDEGSEVFESGTSYSYSWPDCGDPVCAGEVSIYNESLDVTLVKCVEIYNSSATLDYESDVCGGSDNVYELVVNEKHPDAMGYDWSFPAGTTVLPQSDLDGGYAVVNYSLYNPIGTITVSEILPPGYHFLVGEVSVSEVPPPCTDIQISSTNCGEWGYGFLASPLIEGVIYEWYIDGIQSSSVVEAEPNELLIFSPPFGEHTIEVVMTYDEEGCAYNSGCQTTFYVANQPSGPEDLFETTQLSTINLPASSQLIHTLISNPCFQSEVDACSVVLTKVKDVQFVLKLDFGENFNLFNDDVAPQHYDYSVQATAKFLNDDAEVFAIDFELETDIDNPEAYFVYDIPANLYHQFNQVEIYLTAGIGFVGSLPVTEHLRVTSEIQRSVLQSVPLNEVVLNTIDADQNTETGLVTFEWENTCDAEFQNYQFQLLRLHNYDELIEGNEEVIECRPNWQEALTIETQSADEEIELNIVEGSGYYAWRVRPVGNYYEGGISNGRNLGLWSEVAFGAPDPDTETILVSEAADDFSIVFLDNLEENRNWTYSRVLTEAGRSENSGVKIFEQIQFANGLNMPVQNQSKVNSTGDIIVNQSVYDYSGRPAITSLPVPVEMENLLFVPGFILTPGDNPEPYSAAHFDDDNEDPLLNPTPFRIEGTPFEYFSTDHSISEFNGTLPDAHGYPFSQTILKRGNEGILKEKGAPGSFLRIDNSADSPHTIRKLYSNALDDELLRVFGDEAPLGASVRKIVTFDQNNTGSVVYQSKTGQVLATCLSFTSSGEDDALLGLDSRDEAALTASQEMEQGIQNGFNNISSLSIIIEEDNSTIEVDYEINSLLQEFICGAICFQCDYQVYIHLINQETGEIIEAPDYPLNAYADPEQSTLENCDYEENFAPETITFGGLDAGTYQVVKMVSTNNELTDEESSYLDNLLDNVIENEGTTDNYAELQILLSDLETSHDYDAFYNLVMDMNDDLYLGSTFQDLLDEDLNVDPSYLLVPAHSEIDDCGYIEVPVDMCPSECPIYDDQGNINFSIFTDVFIDLYDSDELDTELEKFFGELTPDPNTGYNENLYTLLENMLEEQYESGVNLYSCETIWNCWNSVVEGHGAMQELYAYFSDPGGGMPDFEDMPDIGIDMSTMELPEYRLIDYFLECTGYHLIGYTDEATNNGGILGDPPNVADAGYLTHPYAVMPVTTEEAGILDNPNFDCTTLDEDSPNAAICLCGFINASQSDMEIDLDYPDGFEDFELPDIVSDFPVPFAQFTEEHWYQFYKCTTSIMDASFEGPLPSGDGGLTETCIEACNAKQQGFENTLLETYHEHNMYVLDIDTDPPAGATPVSQEDFNCNLATVMDFCYSHCEFTPQYDGDIVVQGASDDEISNAMHVFGSVLEMDLPDATQSCADDSWTYLNDEEGVMNGVLTVQGFIDKLNDAMTELHNFWSTEASIIENEVACDENWVFTGFYSDSGDLLPPADNDITTMHARFQYCGLLNEFPPQQGEEFCNFSIETDLYIFDLGMALSLFETANPMTDITDESGWNMFLGYYFNFHHMHQYGYWTSQGEKWTVYEINYKINEENIFTIFPGHDITGMFAPNAMSDFQSYFGTFEVDANGKFNFSVENTIPPLDPQDDCHRSYYYSSCEGGASSFGGSLNPVDCPDEATAENAYLQGLYILNGHPGWIENHPLGCSELTTYEEMTAPCMPPCGEICVRWVPLDLTGDEDYTFPPIEPLTCDEQAFEYINSGIQASYASLVYEWADQLEDAYISTCANPDSLDDNCTVGATFGYHHYTLYYYDRAGNLIKTVPPEGVDLLSDETGVIPQNVKDREVPPEHRMVTEYHVNSLGQLRRRKTPDGGLSPEDGVDPDLEEGGETWFYYNSIGQLRFSQNDQQEFDDKYSYTKYDALGRIVETGEAEIPELSEGVTAGDYLSDLELLDDNLGFPAMATQETYTYYTNPDPEGVTYLDGSSPRFLTNRVSYTETDQLVKTHYSYDPHGNVEWVVHDIPELGKQYIGYEYDLVSGNVLSVEYNKGKVDQFFHRYEYDEDNRITQVETSTDGVVWDRDARYQYYPHGPLQRTLIGEDEVQGRDFVYTLQGWLKGINHPSMDPAFDPSNDGDFTLNETGQDVFGMMLSYFAGDFAVNNSPYESSALTDMNEFAISPENAGQDWSLYNGNIAAWSHKTNLFSTTDNWDSPIAGNRYRYDELHRIKHSYFKEFDGTWTDSDAFRTEFGYDANGNINTLVRFDANGDLMDNLSYSYEHDDTPGDETIRYKNRLQIVEEDPTLTASDLGDFYGTSEYKYDLTGNLIEEVSEGDVLIEGVAVSVVEVTSINWNLHGKIQDIWISRTEDEMPADGRMIEFKYDANGNRISKTVVLEVDPIDIANQQLYFTYYPTTTTTYYVRDAQGNVLSTYEKTYEAESGGWSYNYHLTEQPIYGSSRLGLRKYPDQLVKTVLNPNGGPVIEDFAVNGTRVTEFVHYPFSWDFTIFGDNYGILSSVNVGDNMSYDNIGVHENSEFGKAACVAEDEWGDILFGVGSMETYFIEGGYEWEGLDIVMIYDRQGDLMLDSEYLLGDANGQPMVMKAPGDNPWYYLFTVSVDKQLYCHVINPEWNDGNGGIVASNIVVSQQSNVEVHEKFALLEDHTQTNRSNLYIRRYNTATNEQEYVSYTIKDMDISDGEELNTETMFIESLFQPQISLYSTPYGEMQVSPDGRFLYAAQNSGNVIHTFGKVLQFSLDENNTPQYIGQIVSATNNRAITSLDITSGSEYVYYSENEYGVYGGGGKKYTPSLYRANIFDNVGTGDYVDKIQGAVRRLNDGNMYYKNHSTNILTRIIASEDPSWQLVTTNFLIASDELFSGLHATQPHRIYPNNNFYTRRVGEKHYELTDHLGNVRATVTDRKVAGFEDPDNYDWDVTGYTADVSSANDYYPFGWTMPGRRDNPDAYRYGFNGMEKDDEIAGTGNIYTAEFWQYDSRLGRRWNIDPVVAPWESPYAAFRNNPIVFSDPSGDCPDCPEGGEDDDKWQSKDENGNYTGEAAPPIELNEVVITAEASTNDNIAAADNTRVSIPNRHELGNSQSPFPSMQDSGPDYLDIAQKTAGTLGIILGGTGQGLKATETIKALQEGKFIAEFNGKLYRWKMNFYGNPAVPADVVAAEKAAFSGSTKIKVFNAVKVAGTVVSVAGITMTGIQIYQEGEVTVETGADLVFGAVAFVPGWGWVVSGSYFGLKTLNSVLPEAEVDPGTRIFRGDPTLGHCFIAGTQIMMGDFTSSNIEDVQVGDTIKTFNFRSRNIENNVVLKKSEPIHQELLIISFSNGSNNTNTEDHPYYVKGKGWCSFRPQLTYQRYGLQAMQLNVGDICYVYVDQQLQEIKVKAITETNEEVRTYNLTEIANSNNYFANGILIHNESEALKQTSKVPVNTKGQRVKFQPLKLSE